MPGPELWVFRDALGIIVYYLLNHHFFTHLMRITSELHECHRLMKWFVFRQAFMKST